MILCDSNILIYAADPDDRVCAGFVERRDAAISTVCRVEVLGFPGYARLSLDQQQRLQEVVHSMIELRMEELIVEQAIALRQQRRMSLGDAIVAATALVHGIPLVTRNTVDFRHVEKLTVINPFES